MNKDKIIIVSEEIVNLDTVRLAYNAWKELNKYITQDLKSRKVNLPESISENIVCAQLGYKRNITASGDAVDEKGNLIEIKATSNFNSDLSSFSPKTHFDKLMFVRVNIIKDEAEIYDLNLNGDTFGSLKVNKTETVKDHQNQGRRPRLSLIDYIINNKIEPIAKVSLKI